MWQFQFKIQVHIVSILLNSLWWHFFETTTSKHKFISCTVPKMNGNENYLEKSYWKVDCQYCQQPACFGSSFTHKQSLKQTYSNSVAKCLLFEFKNFILLCFLLEILDQAFSTLLNMFLHLQLQSTANSLLETIHRN